MIIYKVTNLINNKIYIGKTIQDLNLRKHNHYNQSLRGSQTKFHKALLKYNKSEFIWEIIYKCISTDELNIMEEYYINQYNSFKKGYNMTKGGDGGVTYKKGDILYEKIKHKLGKWKNGNPGATKQAIQKRINTFKDIKWVSGTNHGNYGHSHNKGILIGSKNPNAKKVIIDGIEYETIVQASKALNVTEDHVRYRCKSSKYLNYNFK
jgi:group I intron endonuclease